MVEPKFMGQLVLQAEELAIEVSGKVPPILLRNLAKRRRVTDVVFCPLLVDAMLTTHSSGFRVFFRSNREDAPTLQKAYANESAAQLLPSRVRFSLAHEFAHTLFYNLSEARPRAGKFAAESQLDDLENICNRLARHLLMPSELLRAEVNRLTRLRPEGLITLAGQFGVSPDALVVRLAADPAFLLMHDFRGCVVALADTSNGYLVKAIARLRNALIPVELRLVRVGELWQVGELAWNEILGGTEAVQKVFPLTIKTAQSSEQRNYVFDFTRFASPSGFDSYLGTIDLAEPP